MCQESRCGRQAQLSLFRVRGQVSKEQGSQYKEQQRMWAAENHTYRTVRAAVIQGSKTEWATEGQRRSAASGAAKGHQQQIWISITFKEGSVGF